MKKIRYTLLITCSLLAGMSRSSAQKTGISFSFFNAAFYANTSPFSQGYMGIGLERNVGDYIALKLELNKGFQVMYKLTKGKILGMAGSNGYDSEWDDSTGSYHRFYYHWTVPSFDINYQSKFFFSGNDRSSAYLAMGIGVRSVKYIFHLGSIDEFGDESSDYPPGLYSKDNYSETMTVIPLILRIGARGDLNGFYPDFSFGVGYNLSHDKTVKDKTITKTWDLTVPKLSGLAITASIAFGIGW